MPSILLAPQTPSPQDRCSHMSRGAQAPRHKRGCKSVRFHHKANDQSMPRPMHMQSGCAIMAMLSKRGWKAKKRAQLTKKVASSSSSMHGNPRVSVGLQADMQVLLMDLDTMHGLHTDRLIELCAGRQ